jgi:ABC-type Mn2+/Zn2+ transport system ATPase subunit
MTILDEIRKTDHLIRHRHSPHHAGGPILRVNGLTLRYERNLALKDVTFEVHTGERLAVVGPNGAGKSTLFKVIAGVLQPTAGQVYIYGQEPGGHICIAFLTQRSQVDWSFPVTVKDVVMMGRIGQMGLLRQPRARDWEIVHRSLERVNLTELEDRQISQLSGGQQQRMFIARALAQEAELILMDEPFSGLDLTAQEDILQILNQLHESGVTVLVAMHDLQLASEQFDRILLLNRRLVAIAEPDEVLTTENLAGAYGGHLRLMTTEDGVLALEDTCCDEGEHYP